MLTLYDKKIQRPLKTIKKSGNIFNASVQKKNSEEF